MSWYPIRKQDYNRERPLSQTRKNQTVYQKKVKLPTQLRTKNEKCSLCKERAVETVVIGKETRKLCQIHLADYKRKNFTYSVKFEKGSKV